MRWNPVHQIESLLILVVQIVRGYMQVVWNSAIHNIQATTPVENIVAMLDAVHEFNGGK